MSKNARGLIGLLIAVALSGCGILGIGGGGATPTPTPACSPPVCGPGQTTICQQADGCPQGCGMVCGDVATQAVNAPTEAPTAIPAPSLSLSSSATDIALGQQVTLSGHNSGIGNPQYNLSLTSDVAGSAPQTFSVTAGQSLPAQAGQSGAAFDLVSASATQTDVTFVLTARQAAKVTASLGANGEVAAPGGAFANGSASAPQKPVVNISQPAAALKIEGPAGDLTVGQTVTLRLTSPDGAAFTSIGLEIANGQAKQTFSAEQGKPYAKPATQADAVLEVTGVTFNAASADFSVKALKPGTASVTGVASGADAGRSEALTLSVLGGTGGPNNQALLTNNTTSTTASEYTVKAGDTLSSIGQVTKVNWTAIADANKLSAPYLIHPGDKLTIPAARVYVVKQGDWLYKIARLLGIDWAALAQANHLVAPYLIKPGDVLTLP